VMPLREERGPWSLGCRAYERTCFALIEASKRHEWLTILPDKERPLRFTFAVGGTPFRFYRGEPNEPPSRYLLITFEEHRQRQLSLDLNFPDTPSNTFLRFAVETDSKGRVTTVSVVEFNELRIPTGCYAIPFEAQTIVVPLRARPIDTPPPVVQALEENDDSVREERNASGL
jgi:hypothetical protein